MDFTINTYRSLLESLQTNGYTFLPFKDYIQTNHTTIQPHNHTIIQSSPPFCILRHDVDDLKRNSLLFAEIQNEMGIKGTYYFRVVPQSYDEKVMKQIEGLGHEIGYHYEDIDIVYSKIAKLKDYKISKEDLIDAAYESFSKNLELFRKNFDIKTICMHGSPRSRYDNKDIWKKYNYRELGIIGEPYFDIDFNDVFYLTDTGRRWDGYTVSIRDKVGNQQDKWEKQGLVFHSTQDIINAVEEDKLPSKIMMTFHPQRWHNEPGPWINELVMQNVKNVVKKVIVSSRLKKKV